MLSYLVNFGMCKNAGDAREWGVCDHYNIKRVKHDSLPYNKASDVEFGEKKISVKSDRFTLMSGTLCGGYTEFEDIWQHYKATTHSNMWAYVCKDGMTFEMNLAEFEAFIHQFCYTEKDSKKNGGHTKIRCRRESEEMIQWLMARV